MSESPPERKALAAEGYKKAIELVEQAAGPHGFVATPVDQRNYRRVWGRDSCITGIAALASGREDLIEATARTLRTLAGHRGPHGEIPSNVDPERGLVSYGGTTGRVDADLWFLIGCGEYWRITRDEAFLDEMKGVIEEVQFLLGCWEFNNKGLLFVPPTGDWADEYVQSGYILYDNMLYLQAQRELAMIHGDRDGKPNEQILERCHRMNRLIRKNYWFDAGSDTEDDAGDVYHPVLYDRGRKVSENRDGLYWMPFFTTTGYGFRFDAFANVLASLMGVADEKRTKVVDAYIESNVTDEETMLLPALLPVITPKDEEWEDLQVSFTWKFKNQPYEYHNGGQWPMVTGFYAADLARRGKTELATKHLDGIHRANRMPMNGSEWSFPEFVHGKKHEPGGVRHMSWSGAGAILAQRALEGVQLFAKPEA
ncbi:MAG: glycoside hydrolase 100 family protein [Verrucomicrobiales bacterium]